MNYLKSQKKLHKKYVVDILNEARKILGAQASLVDWSIPDETTFTVCGDTHGQFYDLVNIFQINGMPSS